MLDGSESFESDSEYTGSDSSEYTGSEQDSDEDSNEGGESNEHTTAAVQIENDFSRLLRDIRESEGEPGRVGMGNLSQMWNLNVENQEEEFLDDLRAASGVGKKGKGKKKQRRRTGPTLSPQVKALIGEGNQAYVDGDTQEAIRLMQEVIRIEPHAAPAWTVLAQCYDDLGDHSKALQLRVMSAHLSHDADEWEQLAKQSRDMGLVEQALYCYGKVYKLDPTNVNAMWDRSVLAKEFGEMRIARFSLLSILKRVPHDLTVLEELRPILVDTGDFALCARLFDGAFEHHQRLFPTGTAPPLTTGSDPVPGGGFGEMELLVLADLHNTLGTHEDAINTIRRGMRWLQGRAHEHFWDACDDDREFDAEGMAGRQGEPSPGHFPLDVNARNRLAVARIKMGHIDEGKVHTSIILAHDVLDYAPLFSEIADAFFERELYKDAQPIYETLGSNATTSSVYVLLQAAACRRALGELREAAEVYEHVIAADPTFNDAKMKLAEVYEILNEPRKALELVYQVIDSRRRGGASQSSGADVSEAAQGSLFQERAKGGRTKEFEKRKFTNEQLLAMEREREKEVLRGYARVKELSPVIALKDGSAVQHEAEREWLFEVEKLIETFRETRRLFQSNRTPYRGMHPNIGQKKTVEDQADDMASRIQLDMAYDSLSKQSKISRSKAPVLTVFRGISFDDWLSLFFQYAFHLAKNGRYGLAEEVLIHITASGVYMNQEAQDSIRLAIIACAIVARKPDAIITQARKIISEHQFNNEPIRLLLASISSGIYNTDAFLSTTLQKHILRELRTSEAALKSKETMKWSAARRRWYFVDAKDEDDGDENVNILPAKGEGFLPSKGNPALFLLYGQMCMAGKSYQSAIFYLLQAYDYCPHDPMICLTLGIASLGRAMQRQADNRQHLIAQGMAFLSQYRTIRAAEAEDETEYNFGRAFHQLGLYTYAVRHYERVLELADGKPEKDWGFAREAAYNLLLIYMLTGATSLAKRISENWLLL